MYKPDRPGNRADEEQANRIDPMHDRPGKEPQGEHQHVGPDESELGIGRAFQHPFGDVGDPAIGAEFNVADQGMNQIEEREQDTAECELRGDGEGQPNRSGDGPTEPLGNVFDAHCSEDRGQVRYHENAEEPGGDREADHPDAPHHLG